MDTSYHTLKLKTDAYYSGKIDQKIVFVTALRLLKKRGIKPRLKDGELIQLGISVPTSVPKAILLGLRYVKEDKTHTEDHFLFQEGRKIQSFYRNKLERILPEYTGAHKIQIPAEDLQ